jgi:hypothetical protein
VEGHRHRRLHGDLRPDIFPQSISGQIVIGHGDAVHTGSTTLTPDGTADAAATIEGIVDLDGDGDQDLIVQQPSAMVEAWIYTGLVRTSVVPLTAIKLAWRLAAVGRQVAGTRDLWWQADGSTSMRVWRMSGANILIDTTPAPGNADPE